MYTSLGILCDLLKWLSDLQLGDEKVTLNHLVYGLYAVLYVLASSVGPASRFDLMKSHRPPKKRCASELLQFGDGWRVQKSGEVQQPTERMVLNKNPSF